MILVFRQVIFKWRVRKRWCKKNHFLNILMILVDFINEIKETKITCKIQLMLKLMLNFTKDADG